jgi:hypothetical protein
MLRRLTKKRNFVVLTAVAALAIAGGAFAYFTSSGTGSGTGSVGSSQSDIVVNQTSTVANLLPGGPSADLSGTLTNNGTSNEYVSGVTAAVTAVSGGGADNSIEACVPSMFSVSGTSTPSEDVAANSSALVGGGATGWTGLHVQLNDDGGNQNNCRGASITISYTAS